MEAQGHPCRAPGKQSREKEQSIVGASQEKEHSIPGASRESEEGIPGVSREEEEWAKHTQARSGSRRKQVRETNEESSADNSKMPAPWSSPDDSKSSPDDSSDASSWSGTPASARPWST